MTKTRNEKLGEVKNYLSIKSGKATSRKTKPVSKSERFKQNEPRSQAKKIMQGLHEAEQIRAGKIKPPTFDSIF